MEDYIVHKVAFTIEAVFDYEHCLIVRNYSIDDDDTDWQKDSVCDLPLVRFPKQDIKQELEEYIQNHSKNKYKHYFKVRHIDENFDKPLMLFIKRGDRQSIMQNWFVVGITFADCWTGDDEEDGIIRAWYETKINNLPDTDWVQEVIIRKESEERDLLKDKKEQEKHERLFG